MNVDGLLRGLTARQFLEWEAYAELEPFGEIRADYRAASIARTVAEVNRDPKKRSEPFEIEDFLLRFRDEAGRRREQTWQEMKTIAHLIVAAYSD